MDSPSTVSGGRGALQHGECVAEAAESVFGAACGLDLTRIDEPDDLGADGVIIAVISVVGDVDWVVFLGLPRATAVSLAAMFAGFEIPFDSDDMGDAVGELTNILAGEVKNQLAKRNRSATISLPSVVRAESLQVLLQRGTTTMKTCFSCEAGAFWTGVVSSREGGFVA